MLQYDGPVVRYLSKIGDMILLNMLWLVCCIPVITAGPATAAAHYVALKFVRDEGGSVIAMFFQSFRSNLRQGIILGAAATVTGVILLADLWLILTGKITFSPLARLFILAFLWLLMIIYVLVMIYIWAILAKFNNSIKKMVFYALVLAVANIRSTLIILCWDISLLTVAVLCFAFLPQLAVLCVIFGIPALFILNCTRLRPVLDRCADKLAR